MYVNMYRKVAKGRPGHTVYGTPSNKKHYGSH